jgi:hypothetical protein
MDSNVDAVACSGDREYEAHYLRARSEHHHQNLEEILRSHAAVRLARDRPEHPQLEPDLGHSFFRDHRLPIVEGGTHMVGYLTALQSTDGAGRESQFSAVVHAVANQTDLEVSGGVDSAESSSAADREWARLLMHNEA